MPFPTRSYIIPISSTKPSAKTEETISLALTAPPLSAQGLRFDTWGSSSILASQLHKFTLPPAALISKEHGYQILELGAGTGLAGLAAASVWGASVVLTDLPEVLVGIEANVDGNSRVLGERGGSARVGELDWRNQKVLRIVSSKTDAAAEEVTADDDSKFGLILAADTLYSVEQPQLLRDTIITWLRRDVDARVVLCYPLRVAYIDVIREFWDLMAEARLEAKDEGRETLPEGEFDDERLCEWCVWKWKDDMLK